MQTVSESFPQVFGDLLELLAGCGSTIGAYILTIAYGIKTKPINDPFVALSEKAIQLGNEAFLSPLSFLLYLAPVLQSLPEWCLGPGFKHRAKQARSLAHEFRNAPFDEVERMIVGPL